MALPYSAGHRTDAGPAQSFVAVSPSDTVNLLFVPRGLYVGSAGDVVALNEAAAAVTFSAVQAGTILPIRTTRVNATGTTASNIVALY